jgi:hypothetical protein
LIRKQEAPLLVALIFKHLHPFLKSVHFILSVLLEAEIDFRYRLFRRPQIAIAVFGKELVGISNNLFFN